MKKRKDTYFFKILALAVLLCIIAGFLAFCGRKTEPEKETETPPQVSVEPTDPTPPTTPPQVFTKTLQERMIEKAARYYGVSVDAYPESMVELLTRNRETQGFVLAYPDEIKKERTVDMSAYKNTQGVPLFMQWDRQWGYNQYGQSIAALNGCGPVSLSMVAYYYTRDDAMAPDKMLEYAYEKGYCTPGYGTAWTLISKGAVDLGFTVKELPNVKRSVMRELEAGHPIILNVGPGDFTTTGHYMVMVGVEDGLIRINDCNSYANSSKLWDFDQIESQIRNMWAISYEGNT